MGLTFPPPTAGNTGTAPNLGLMSRRYAAPFAQFQHNFVMLGIRVNPPATTDTFVLNRGLHRKDTPWMGYGSIAYGTMPAFVPETLANVYSGNGMCFLPNGRLLFTYMSAGATGSVDDDQPVFYYHDGLGGDLGDVNKGWVGPTNWPLATPQILNSGFSHGRAWILYTVPNQYPNWNDNLGDLYIAFNTNLIGDEWDEYLIEAKVTPGSASGVWLGNEWLVTYQKLEASGYRYLYTKRFSAVPAWDVPGSHFVIEGYPHGPGNYNTLSLSSMAQNQMGVLMAFPGYVNGPIPFAFNEGCFVSIDRGHTWKFYRLPNALNACPVPVSPLYMQGWLVVAAENSFVAVRTGNGTGYGQHRITENAGIHQFTTYTSPQASWPCP